MAKMKYATTGNYMSNTNALLASYKNRLTFTKQELTFYFTNTL